MGGILQAQTVESWRKDETNKLKKILIIDR